MVEICSVIAVCDILRGDLIKSRGKSCGISIIDKTDNVRYCDRITTLDNCFNLGSYSECRQEILARILPKVYIVILSNAYEITVDSTSKPSIPYANSILERWYAEGYRTLEDVDAALAEYKRKKAGDGSSFDVDEWFEAALKRTYGE
jgi:DnaD/phage-associated family protein